MAYPPLVGFAHYLWPEVLHLALWVAVLWILVARRGSWLWLVGLGLCLGLAFLTKTLLAPFLPVLLVPLVWHGQPREGVLRAALVVFVIMLVVSPTLVRNSKRYGVVTIANSGWFNLWVGLNETSRKDFDGSIVGDEYREFQRSAPTFPERNAILREKIAALVRERGLLRVLGDQLGRQFFRLFDKDSLLTDQLPGGAIHRLGGGYRAPPAAVSWLVRTLSYGMYAALLVGTAAGLALLGRRNRPWVGFIWSFVAYNLLLMLFLHVKTRYRVQLMPFSFFLSAYAFFRLTPSQGEARPPVRALAGAAVGAAVLLILAFS